MIFLIKTVVDKYKKKSGWLKYCAAEVCLCLVIVGLLFASPHRLITKTLGLLFLKMDVFSSVNEATNIFVFFIYQGRRYVQYEWVYDNKDIIGEYPETAIEFIGEWTQKKEMHLELNTSMDCEMVAGLDFRKNFFV